MRRLRIILGICLVLAGTFSAGAVTGHVLKVLPHFLDQQGRHTLSPSLFDRDAYQAQLRKQPEKRSAIRFDVSWRVRAPKGTKLTLKVELRGIAHGNLPREKTLTQEVVASVGSKWTGLTLGGDDYKEFGEVTAWRATLWDGDKLLSEQKSFLW